MRGLGPRAEERQGVDQMWRLSIVWMVAMLVSSMAVSQDLSQVRSWTYWLSGPKPALISASGFDMAVVDRSRDGTRAGAFTPDEVRLMQTRPDGGRRIVLAYMSIGEAEDYRGYWRKEWRRNPPDWLEAENPDWQGNFKVRYWHPDWQQVIYGSPGSYLDRIIDQGFDGVYLDIVDAYWYFQEKGRKSAAAEMIRFVADIAAHARTRRPGFLIVPQNAEDLLADTRYRAVIDAQAKEDLLFGLDGDDTANGAEAVDWPLKHLKLALEDGKQVLLVEYPTERRLVEITYRRGRALGVVPYAAVRALDRMVVNRGLDPATPGLHRRE